MKRMQTSTWVRFFILPAFIFLVLTGFLFWLNQQNTSLSPNEQAEATTFTERPQATNDQPTAAVTTSSAKDPEPQTTSAAKQIEAASLSLERIMANTRALTAWAQQNKNASRANNEVIELGQQRGRMMRQLIPQNPEVALAAMLSLEVYRDLPQEVRELIESPFASAGSLSVVPDCSSGSPDPDYLARWDGTSRQVFIPKARQDTLSKDWTSLSGIEIDKIAAIHAEPVWVLSESDLEAAADLFHLELPSENKATALVAGEFTIIEEDELRRLSEEMRRAERTVNPAERPIMADEGTGGESSQYEETIEALFRPLNKVDTDWSLTDKKVLFLNLKFSDSAATAVTKSQLEARLAECSTRTAEMSYGAMSFSTTVVSNDLTLPGTLASYDDANDINYWQIYDEALALAVTAGLITSTNQSEWSTEYDIIGVVFPEHSGAFWSGRASIGGRKHWINGDASFGTYIHEFGHNYGLQHASRWIESTPAEIPPTPSTANNLSTNTDVEPRHSEYGDWFDYMGGDGEFGVIAKSRLSWIPDSKIVDMTGDTMKDQTVRLYRFDETEASTKPTLGAIVQMQNSETFWLSYRGNHSLPVASEGAHVVWQFTSDRARLLDMTPESSSYPNNILPIGRTFLDPSGLVTITPLAKDETGNEEWLDIRIVTGVVGNNNPSLNLSVDQPSSNVLDTLTFTAMGSDTDGDPLVYNWDFGDGRTETATGANLSHTYQIGGTFTVTVSAIDGRGGYAETTQQVVVADPLVTLKEVNSGISSTLYDAVEHNGRLYALSNYELLTSFDGLTWTELPTPSPLGPHYGIFVDDSGIILVGAEYLDDAWRAQIWESSNGLTWETNDAPAGTGFLRSVCKGGGVFIAVGDSGTIMRKPTGGTWQQVNAAQTQELNKVVYDGSRFWALGDDGLILTSPDGSTWSPPISTPEGSSWSDFKTAVSAGNGFFVGGDDGRAGVTTNAGDDWVEKLDTQKDIIGLTQLAHRVVCFGNDFNSMVDQTQSEVIFATTAGDSWAEAPLATPFRIYDAEFGAGRLIGVGLEGTIQISDPFYPRNQAPTSTLRIPPNVPARQDFSPLGSVADLDGDTLYYYWNTGEGWYQSDTLPTFNFLIGGSKTIGLTVVDGKGGVLTQAFNINVVDPLLNFSAVSVADTVNYSKAVCSNDQHFAISWGKLHVGAIGEALVEAASINPFYPFDIATDGTTLMLVGQTYDFNLPGWVGGISSSTINTPHPLGKATIPSDSRFIRGVAYGAGNWVAVGDDGRLLTKRGTENWIEISSGVTTNLNGIAYGNGIFMIVGDSSKILVSNDGSSWTPLPAPTENDLSAVEYSGIGFTVASSNYIHFTNDLGANWHNTMITNSRYNSFLWTGESIIAAGTRYDFDQSRWVPHLFVSLDGINWQYLAYEAFAGIEDLTLCGDGLMAVGNSGALLHTVLASAAGPPFVANITASDPSTAVRITFPSQPGELFDVYRTEDLSAGFGETPYASLVPAASTGNSTEWTDHTPPPKICFYQIRRR